ncbi:hypothetical protein [Burkholderia ubonensis]|uniref:hypothetical protein n=1 Tax=Burkholderia ubonensis TaxID=101571 RepID=UPI000759F213|nr:hypothetical protein [Burkholderia ubonensis]KVV07410.1 hypothetical protein WK77_16620 [Burkholderia ubonensis]
MKSVKTPHTHTAEMAEETAVNFGAAGSKLKYDVIVPAGTRCVKLEGGGGTPVWVVEDLSFIEDKQSILYHDAYYYGIKVEESQLTNIAAVGQAVQTPALRVVPGPEDNSPSP